MTRADARPDSRELYYKACSKSMGKRELILIVVFVMLGATVYQFTAPPPAPGERTFSFSRIVDEMRREVRGNRASAEVKSTTTEVIDESITELRFTPRTNNLTIVGEDRKDVEANLAVRSTGYDDAEARKLAGETQVKYDRSGSVLFVTIQYPEPGSQTARLSLKIPARLKVRIEPNSGRLEVSNVTDVELANARGETILKDIKGRVSGTHRGGELKITDAGSLKLTTRGSDTRIERIRGETVISTQAGDLRGTGVVGPIEVESNSTDVTLEGLDQTTGMVRINATGGSIVMKGVRSESRIDLRNAELELAIDRPAIVAVYSEGEEPVEITPPAAGGFRLDVVAREADITATPEGLFKTWGLAVDSQGEDKEHRLTGDVAGGGPLVTVRSQRGSILFRGR